MNQKKNKLTSQQKKQARPEQLFGDKLSFAATEAYKLLRTNLFFCLPASEGRTCPVVGITSAVQGEGKSTTAINLAYMLAEDGKRICLIEGDMRAPTFNKRLNLNRKDGLSQVLAGMQTDPKAIFSTALHENLSVIPAGEMPPNPAELLGSERMAKLIGLLKGVYEYIIIDLPPITVVADALAVSGVLDGIVVVVQDGTTTRRQLNDSMQRLNVIKSKILGFVVTRADSGRGRYGKKKYGYGYYYGYGYGHEKK